MRERSERAGFGRFVDGEDGFMAVRETLKIIVSASVHRGELWAHVSASYSNALPSWVIMKRIKRDVLGRETKAIMVLPPESEHVNIHPFVHHIWCRLDGDPHAGLHRGNGVDLSPTLPSSTPSANPSLGAPSGSGVDARAVAHRLCLCWNLMEGWPTEALEAGALREVDEAARALLDRLRGLVLTFGAVEAAERLRDAFARRDPMQDMADGRPADCDGCYPRALRASLDESDTRARDAVPREPGCLCTWEAGDSPCHVHGDDAP